MDRSQRSMFKAKLKANITINRFVGKARKELTGVSTKKPPVASEQVVGRRAISGISRLRKKSVKSLGYATSHGESSSTNHASKDNIPKDSESQDFSNEGSQCQELNGVSKDKAESNLSASVILTATSNNGNTKTSPDVSEALSSVLDPSQHQTDARINDCHRTLKPSISKVFSTSTGENPTSGVSSLSPSAVSNNAQQPEGPDMRDDSPCDLPAIDPSASVEVTENSESGYLSGDKSVPPSAILNVSLEVEEPTQCDSVCGLSTTPARLPSSMRMEDFEDQNFPLVESNPIIIEVSETGKDSSFEYHTVELQSTVLSHNTPKSSALVKRNLFPLDENGAETCSNHNIDDMADLPIDIVTESSDTNNVMTMDSSSLGESIFDPTITSTANKKKQTRNYTPPEKLTRKRQRNPQNWKRNRNKEKIALGEEYTTKKGKIMKGKKLQPPCDESCRMKCTSKVTEQRRTELFNYYWKKLLTKPTKWLYLQSLVIQVPKITNPDNAQSKRQHSRKYFLPLKNDVQTDKDRVQVCKVMFLATFDLCESQVSTAEKKKALGSPDDKRGKNVKRPMPINESLKISVRDHIKSLPKMPPHYTRANSQKEYLVGSIESVSQLHEMYQDWMKSNAPTVPVATYRQYGDIFNQEFNLEFFISKKDSCDLCTQYENSSEEEKAQMQEEYDDHSKNQTLAQTMRLADQEVAKRSGSQNLAVACFDFEKTLICPKATESVFYYRRKLSVSNFTIVRVGKANEERCYVWDETTARKGANEVASCLMHFCDDKIAEGVTEFRIYCDNCWGQNKNRAVTSLLALLVGRYKDKNIRITLRFLEKGHSYNAADTVHSMIEAKTRKANIYSPEEWYNKMENAKRSKEHPIKVIRVKQDMILNFWELAEKLNFAKDQAGATIPISKIREIVCDSDDPYKVKFKLSLDSNCHRIISLKKKGKPVNFETYQLKGVYTGLLPITQKKLADLLYYCNHNLIPAEHQAFFRGLVSGGPDADNEDDDTILMAGPAGTGRARKRRARQPTAKGRRGKRAHTEDSGDEDDPDFDL